MQYVNFVAAVNCYVICFISAVPMVVLYCDEM